VVDRRKESEFSGVVLDCMRNRITNEVAGPALGVVGQALAEKELVLHQVIFIANDLLTIPNELSLFKNDLQQVILSRNKLSG